MKMDNTNQVLKSCLSIGALNFSKVDNFGKVHLAGNKLQFRRLIRVNSE